MGARENGLEESGQSGQGWTNFVHSRLSMFIRVCGRFLNKVDKIQGVGKCCVFEGVKK